MPLYYTTILYNTTILYHYIILYHYTVPLYYTIPLYYTTGQGQATDLWSGAEQLLVFQSQPLLLHLQLLEPHLVAARHDSSALGTGGQLAPLLAWTTLGDTLLVQAYRGERERNSGSLFHKEYIVR